jgi:hypothetical protein
MGDNATPSRFSLAQRLDEGPFRFVSIANQPTPSPLSAATRYYSCGSRTPEGAGGFNPLKEAQSARPLGPDRGGKKQILL